VLGASKGLLPKFGRDRVYDTKKSTNISWATGRKPLNAAPAAAPMNALSVIVAICARTAGLFRRATAPSLICVNASPVA
jgi:hypothetical protein